MRTTTAILRYHVRVVTLIVLVVLAVGCESSAVDPSPSPPTEVPPTSTPVPSVPTAAPQAPTPTPGVKQAIIILYPRFEEREYGQTRQALEESGVVVTVAASSLEPVRGHQGTDVQPDTTLRDAKAADYDAVVFIGAYEFDFDDPEAIRLAQEAVAERKVLAAICAAPRLLAQAGVLKGRRATTSLSPSVLENEGAIYTGLTVERDGLIITANGPYASSQFGTEIVMVLEQGGAGPLSFADSGQRLGEGRGWDVSLGDLDGDDDLDAFVANGSSGGVGNAVWLNDGHGKFTTIEQSLGYGMGVDLGDLDDDADLDAFIASWDEAGQVWLNDGSGTFSNSGQALGSEGGWDVALGDLDGDGDLDAFVAHTEANTVWLNDGNGVFTDSAQRLGNGITAVVALDDLDQDGDLDALTAGWNEPAKVWLNDGAGALRDNDHPLTPGHIHVHGMALGDVDGDGDIDAYLAGGSGHHQIWLNDGHGVLNDSGQQLFGPAGSGIALGDLDGDGDLDVFAAIGDRGSSDDKVWLNDGGAQGGTPGYFTDSGLALSTGFSSDVELGDLDGDGDLDAFVVHGDLRKSSGGEMPNEVWLNETNPSISASSSTDTPVQASGDARIRPTDGTTMVYVPSGEFLMGSTAVEIDAIASQCEQGLVDQVYCERKFYEYESPQHPVRLDGFWMDRVEVTNAQYALCVKDGDCRESRLANDPIYNGDDYPVAGIPSQDAADYCAWAGGRLPTEAEWEYAARGTEGRIYPWGDTFDCAGGNFGDDLTGCDDSYAHTAPVGSFPAGVSWCGVLDMAGNVWEWVADRFGDYLSVAQTNPMGPTDGDLNLLRGGSWGYGHSGVRAAYRYPVPPSANYLGVGFRCVVPFEE